MDDEYITRLHKELWIPAEELDELNRHLLGEIRVIEAYYGENYVGDRDYSVE